MSLFPPRPLLRSRRHIFIESGPTPSSKAIPTIPPLPSSAPPSPTVSDAISSRYTGTTITNPTLLNGPLALIEHMLSDMSDAATKSSVNLTTILEEQRALPDTPIAHSPSTVKSELVAPSADRPLGPLPSPISPENLPTPTQSENDFPIYEDDDIFLRDYGRNRFPPYPSVAFEDTTSFNGPHREIHPGIFTPYEFDKLWDQKILALPSHVLTIEPEMKFRGVYYRVIPEDGFIQTTMKRGTVIAVRGHDQPSIKYMTTVCRAQTADHAYLQVNAYNENNRLIIANDRDWPTLLLQVPRKFNGIPLHPSLEPYYEDVEGDNYSDSCIPWVGRLVGRLLESHRRRRTTLPTIPLRSIV
ncbi:hypothetical protein GALMADRAFT_133947 [Galerina marginata CBS 339.88]|uniref:Uncharacterized protein n=1 Tax=Galerina marginata (strain CBS 339.88) TaxID=685588 RepID=A0A067TTI8_GALM3|nr:hypothetical protein GALMADRAFT_133947 [Galerina marginata CBS 339.88]